MILLKFKDEKCLKRPYNSLLSEFYLTTRQKVLHRVEVVGTTVDNVNSGITMCPTVCVQVYVWVFHTNKQPQ